MCEDPPHTPATVLNQAYLEASCFPPLKARAGQAGATGWPGHFSIEWPAAKVGPQSALLSNGWKSGVPFNRAARITTPHIPHPSHDSVLTNSSYCFPSGPETLQSPCSLGSGGDVSGPMKGASLIHSLKFKHELSAHCPDEKREAWSHTSSFCQGRGSSLACETLSSMPGTTIPPSLAQSLSTTGKAVKIQVGQKSLLAPPKPSGLIAIGRDQSEKSF